MKKETIAQEALRLISSVPATDFTTNEYTDFKCKCCTVGHIYRLKSEDPTNYNFKVPCDEDLELLSISQRFIKEKYGAYNDIFDVNDTDGINGYTEQEIKDRAVHFLTDMVKAGY